MNPQDPLQQPNPPLPQAPTPPLPGQPQPQLQNPVLAPMPAVTPPPVVQENLAPAMVPTVPQPVPVLPQQTPAAMPGYQQPAGIPPQQQKSGNKKKLLIVGLIVLLVLLVAGGALALVSGSKKKSNKESSSTNPTPTDSAKIDEAPVSEEKTSEPKKQSEVAITKTVTADLGVTVQVNKMIRNFVNEDVEDGDEAVLVEVTVSSDGSYTKATGKSDFRLVADGKEVKASYLVSSTDMKNAGFTPLESSSVKKDKPVTGFVAFEVPANAKKLVLRYHRGETKILGGQTLPAKDFDIVLAE